MKIGSSICGFNISLELYLSFEWISTNKKHCIHLHIELINQMEQKLIKPTQHKTIEVFPFIADLSPQMKDETFRRPKMENSWNAE